MSQAAKVAVGIALLLLVVGTALGYAEKVGGRPGERLSGEQRAAIRARIHEMREAGAPRDNIHASVKQMLERYGVTPREVRHQGRGEGRGHSRCVGRKLTAEQREAVRARVREMRRAGSSREEVRLAVRSMMSEFGINLPARAGRGEAVSRPLGSGPNPGEGTRWGEVKAKFR
jgi:hypothetical protein